ncbi:hypothetical protein M514_27506, partial [Trichuris suis]
GIFLLVLSYLVRHFPRKSKIYVHSGEHPENRPKYV